MLIKSFEVRNFRAIQEARIDCDNLTALVGRNGTGKSSFLKALEVFYDVAAPITSEDFFGRNTTNPIEISVTYGDLRNDEKDEFAPYIKTDQLMVIKRIADEEGRIVQRYYSLQMQLPEFNSIRSIAGKMDRKTEWNTLVDSPAFEDSLRKVRNADEIEPMMAEYENKHPELLQPMEKQEQFFGPRNIGGGKLDKFTRFVLVPAVREATDETTGRKSAIYQILDMIVFRKINSRKDIIDFKAEFEERVKKLYSSENLKELPLLGNDISTTLKLFAPGAMLNLAWEEVKLPEIALPNARATLTEDDFEGEINRKGHGLQRALILTLLQHLAMTVPEEPSDSQTLAVGNGQPGSSAIKPAGPDLILAIEEPELYLHPARQRYLSELLLKLAANPKIGLAVKNQIIYTTHSPYFVDLQRFDNIRIVKKKLDREAPCMCTSISSFSLKEAAKCLSEINVDSDPSKFTRDSFKARAMSIMNVLVNEGFFADVVVVVEGQSEMGALWKLQYLLGKNWAELGIVVVPTSGKNNIDRPVVIFRGLGIPTYFIFDGDSRFQGKANKDEKEARTRNARYLKLASASVSDFPKTTVEKTWAVFNNNLEGIFEESLGKDDFFRFREEVASELGYDQPAYACKNIEGVARLVEIAHERNLKIRILEKIVESISALRLTS